MWLKIYKLHLEVIYVLGSPYKVYIDEALLKLKENGDIQKLKDLWWKEKMGGGKCGVSRLYK